MCDDTDRVKKTMEPCSVKPKWFNCLDNSLTKNNIMPQNKLKQKVEALTNVVQALIKELQHTTSVSQGTLTAFQLHLGEKEWGKVIKQLQERELEEQEKQNKQEKKLEL
jgi:uncharacterized Fe-S center protein